MQLRNKLIETQAKTGIKFSCKIKIVGTRSKMAADNPIIPQKHRGQHTRDQLLFLHNDYFEQQQQQQRDWWLHEGECNRGESEKNNNK